MRAVVEAAKQQVPGTVVKVIVESALLVASGPSGVLEAACEAVNRAGADFIKTSTGFHPAGGATPEAVATLFEHRGSLRVKAAGGIRTWSDAVNMVNAGAERLGCSAGVAIVSGGSSDSAY